MFLGHVNARTPKGLTSLGEFALKAMMKRGMIIDIDHIRERNSGDLSAENARTKSQLAQVACLGGMFGVGTEHHCSAWAVHDEYRRADRAESRRRTRPWRSPGP